MSFSIDPERQFRNFFALIAITGDYVNKSPQDFNSNHLFLEKNFLQCHVNEVTSGNWIVDIYFSAIKPARTHLPQITGPVNTTVLHLQRLCYKPLNQLSRHFKLRVP